MSRESELIELANIMLKDAGLGAGGAQATVCSTGFTPTFGGGGVNICAKCKKKKECKIVADKCDQGWGVCASCDVCKDTEKHLAFSHVEIIKSADGGIYIAGYASPWVIDDEGHRIERPALKEALDKFMFQPMFRNVMLSHSGIQVGFVVPETVDSSGKVYKSRVDDEGLFVVCKLRDDILPGKELIEAINKGEVDSFSIRGRGLQSEFKCEGGRCFWSVTKLELYEITVCKRGVNPDAKFVLLKSKDFDYDKRIYLKPGEVPPEGTIAQTGPKGARFYIPVPAGFKVPVGDPRSRKQEIFNEMERLHAEAYRQVGQRGSVMGSDLPKYESLEKEIAKLNKNMGYQAAREAVSGVPFKAQVVRTGHPQGIFFSDVPFNEFGSNVTWHDLELKNPTVFKNQWDALDKLFGEEESKRFDHELKTVERTAGLSVFATLGDKVKVPGVVQLFSEMDQEIIKKVMALGHDGIVYYHDKKEPLHGEYVDLTGLKDGDLQKQVEVDYLDVVADRVLNKLAARLVR